MSLIEDSTSKEIGPRRQPYDVLGIGALNYDSFVRAELLEEIPDLTVHLVTSAEKVAGGSAVNTMGALALLGQRVAMNGVVADDPRGRHIVRQQEGWGIVTDLVRVIPDTQTPDPLIAVHENGGRQIFYEDLDGEDSLGEGVKKRASSEYGEQDANAALRFVRDPGVRIVHASSFVEDLQTELLGRTLRAMPGVTDALISMCPGPLYSFFVDTGGKAHSLKEPLHGMYESLDTAFFNREEICILMGFEAFEEAALAYLREFEKCKLVSVTLGAGEQLDASDTHMSVLYIRDQDGKNVQAIAVPRWNPPQELPVIDTTGAGDLHAAGVLLDHLDGRPWQTWGATSVVLSRLCVSSLAATTAVPSPAELEDYRQTVAEPMIRTLKL